MLIKCIECDHILLDDEAEYIYEGKPYCENCYRAPLRSWKQRNKMKKHNLNAKTSRNSLRSLPSFPLFFLS